MRLRAATLAAARPAGPRRLRRRRRQPSTAGDSRLPPAGGGGTLGYALPALPATLDPLAAQSRVAQTVTRQVYEPLIERLAGPYVQPARRSAGLALSAQPSPDRTTWTVTLRTGVRFQDGTPFNAAAVRRQLAALAEQRRGARAAARTCSRWMRRAPTRSASCSTGRSPTWPGGSSSPRLGIVSPQALDPQSGRGRPLPRRTRPAPGRAPSSSGPRGPGRLEPRSLRRLVGKPARARARRSTASPSCSRPSRLSGCGLLAGGSGPGRRSARSRPACAPPTPIRCSTPSAGRSPGSASRAQSAGSTPRPAVPVLSGVWLTRLTG